MRDFVKLSTRIADDYEFVSLTLEAQLLFLRGLSKAGTAEPVGTLPANPAHLDMLLHLGGRLDVATAAKELVAAGFWREDGARWAFTRWQEHQTKLRNERSPEEASARGRADALRGWHERGKHEGNPNPDCPTCAADAAATDTAAAIVEAVGDAPSRPAPAVDDAASDDAPDSDRSRARRKLRAWLDAEVPGAKATVEVYRTGLRGLPELAAAELGDATDTAGLEQELLYHAIDLYRGEGAVSHKDKATTLRSLRTLGASGLHWGVEAISSQSAWDMDSFPAATRAKAADLMAAASEKEARAASE